MAQTPTGDHWHLKREVNISHIIATATLALGLVSWGLKMDQRMTRIEALVAAQRDVDDRQDRATDQVMRGVTGRLDRIDNKLDRLIEARP